MILLDTNALLWVLGDSKRVGSDARQSIAAAERVYSSSVSFFEISIKSMLGRLTVPGDLPELSRESGVDELSLTHRHVAAVEDFPELARHDPFDRLLVAQAYVERLTLLTADRVLLGLGRSFVRDVRI